MVAENKGGLAAAARAWRLGRCWPGAIACRAFRIGMPVFLILAGVGGGFSVLAGAQPDRVDVELGAPSVFHAVPEMVTQLDSGGSARQRYVRLAVVLEVPATDADRMEAGGPVILDAVQEHLRTLRPADLAGEAGTRHLRRAVREIVHKRVGPSELRGVLFTQLLVG